MGRGRIVGARLHIPLASLGAIVTAARSMERVQALVRAYQAGIRVAAIPVRVSKHGNLGLEGDGNHRLAAARLAGLSHVDVIVDARNAERVRKFVGV